jgi:hypothetical protein
MLSSNIINTIYNYCEYNTFKNLRLSYVEFYNDSFYDDVYNIKTFEDNRHELIHNDVYIGNYANDRNDVDIFNLRYLYFNDRTNHITLPYNIVYLHLGDDFNSDIDALANNTTIKYLRFGYRFNKNIRALDGNNIITHLTFGYSFNKPIEPLKNNNTITHLTFGYKFNEYIKPLTNNNSITNLTFGNSFNRSILHLQNNTSIRKLIFGHRFNHPIYVLQTMNVRYLELGYAFNCDIDHFMHNETITHLMFSNHFNRTLYTLQNNTTLRHINALGASLPYLYKGVLHNLVINNIDKIRKSDPICKTLRYLEVDVMYDIHMDTINNMYNLRHLKIIGNTHDMAFAQFDNKHIQIIEFISSTQLPIKCYITCNCVTNVYINGVDISNVINLNTHIKHVFNILYKCVFDNNTNTIIYRDLTMHILTHNYIDIADNIANVDQYINKITILSNCTIANNFYLCRFVCKMSIKHVCIYANHDNIYHVAINKNITHLELLGNFNSDLWSLCDNKTLVYLRLGDFFNKGVYMLKRTNLKHIEFGVAFNQHPKYIICNETLKKVTVSKYYKHDLSLFRELGIEIVVK